MSDLQTLANQKAIAEQDRRISALRRDIEVLMNDHAAQGRLFSSLTLKRTLALCVAAFESQRASVIAEYRWAINQALLVSQSWVERLIGQAVASLDPMHKECEEQIRKACSLVRTPERATQLLSDFRQAEQAAAKDIAFALRSCFSERRRGLVRGIPGLASRLLSRIFRGSVG